MSSGLMDRAPQNEPDLPHRASGRGPEPLRELVRLLSRLAAREIVAEEERTAAAPQTFGAD